MDVVIIAGVFSSDVNSCEAAACLQSSLNFAVSGKIEHIFLGHSPEKGEKNRSTNCSTLRLIYFTNAFKVFS